MTLVTLSNNFRAPGDPRLEHPGPSSLTPADNLARALGWFSLALGIAELLAPGRIAGAVGLDGKKTLVRAYGAREVLAGMLTLSMDKRVGLASRILGDMLDVATLMAAVGSSNPKRGNAVVTLGAVTAITVLDCLAYAAATATHSRNRGEVRDYSNRSGLPRGVEVSRGLARFADSRDHALTSLPARHGAS